MPPRDAQQAVLSASIVYYDNAHYIERTLPPTLEALRTVGAEIYLIDNASTDNTQEVIQKVLAHSSGNVHFLHSEVNNGFGRGHSLVLDLIKSKYHLICNPDLIIDGQDTLAKCLEFLDGNPDVGMMTLKLLNEDGSLQAGNKTHPNVLDLLLRRVFPNAKARWIQKRMEHYEMRDIGYDQVVDVEFMPGSFLIIRTDAWKQVGGFDPRYFLYFEDADLGREIQRAKLRTVYFPGASVTHFWERASHKSIRGALILVMNGIRYFNKWGWKLY